MAPRTHVIVPRLLDPEGHGRLGVRGEQLAAVHLRDDDGLEVVARNWRLSRGAVRGELDVVALDHDRHQVVVCEVKTRRGHGYGGPFAAVTARKQQALRRLAVAFLTAARLPYRDVRFDVIGVWLPDEHQPRLEHREAVL